MFRGGMRGNKDQNSRRGTHPSDQGPMGLSANGFSGSCPLAALITVSHHPCEKIDFLAGMVACAPFRVVTEVFVSQERQH